MTRFQTNQLKFWIALRDIEVVTVTDFLRAQPRWIPWLWFALVACWGFAEILGLSSLPLRLFAFAGFYFVVVLFFRTRAYWPIQRQVLDWEKIDRIVRNSIR